MKHKIFILTIIVALFPLTVFSGEWTWQNPLPQGYTLSGVWGSSGSDVFAVGGNDTILHYNGSTQSAMTNPLSGTTNYLYSVWGSSGSDVFAVGDYGTILHYGETGTTTTIPVTTTTTTTPRTTTTSSGGCPAKTVMGQSSPALNILRAFRNDIFIKSATGKYYTALYYKHALELSGILNQDDTLKEKRKDLILKIMPTISDLLNKKEAAINEGTIKDAIALIDALTAQASPAFERDLNKIKKDIQSGNIFNTFKVKIQRD